MCPRPCPGIMGITAFVKLMTTYYKSVRLDLCVNFGKWDILDGAHNTISRVANEDVESSEGLYSSLKGGENDMIRHIKGNCFNFCLPYLSTRSANCFGSQAAVINSFPSERRPYSLRALPRPRELPVINPPLVMETDWRSALLGNLAAGNVA